MYIAQGKYDEALLQHQRSLEINLQVLGSEHPDVAASYNNMAGVYSAQCKFDEALVQYQKGLEIWLQVHGSEHHYVASSYAGVGGVYEAQGKYEEALVQYQKASRSGSGCWTVNIQMSPGHTVGSGMCT